MPKYGTAQSVRRVEDPRLLKGSGRYTDDFSVPDMLHGIVLRSPYAAASITGIDIVAARQIPGVRAVYTSKDLAEDGIGLLPCLIPLKTGMAVIGPMFLARPWPMARYAMWENL